MQIVFTILVAVIAGCIAIKRGRSGWWGLLVGALFVGLDSIVSLALVAAVEGARRPVSDATFSLIAAGEKTLLTLLFLGVFSGLLKRAGYLPPESEKKATLGL